MTSTGPSAPKGGSLSGERLREHLVDWAKEANQALNSTASAVGLTEKVEQRPYAMLGAAVGVGYVLGGGLFTSTTARLIRMGLKLAHVPVVQDKMLEVAEAALDGLLARTKKPESK